MGKLLKWLFIGLFGLTLLGMIIDGTKTPEQKAAELQQRQDAERRRSDEDQQKARAEMATLPTYTANDMARAYEENTVAADALFKGKKFKVTGTVASINTDFMGNPYITLRGGVNQFMEPQFGFDDSFAPHLSQWRKGAKVQLVCIGKGDVAKTPMSSECVPL